MSNLDIIVRELQRVPGRKKHTATNIMICCPFHDDRTPSCGIYTVPNGRVPIGYFSCFGCGVRGGWNKLAARLGLQEIEYAHKITHSYKKELKLMEDHQVSMPYGVIYGERWRGIKGQLLKELGVVLGKDHHEKISCLYLPIRVNKRLVAVLKGRLKKKKFSPSYVVHDQIDQGIKNTGLFPYDYVKTMLSDNQYRHLILVEGSRDALRLIQCGIPALAILGTNMWSSHKQKLVTALCERYEVIPCVMMDSDKAGKKAQRSIVFDFKTKQQQVVQIKLWNWVARLNLKKLDGGSLPSSLIRSIRNLCLPLDQ